MSDTITYQYKAPSSLQRKENVDELFLARYSEIQKTAGTCFFRGILTDPFITARSLIALSNIVQSSFNLSPFELAKLKDPIVTAGNNKIRFEGFSQCAGVYARLDISEAGYVGEFQESGTTNVDFNQPMISALSRINKNESVILSVGKEEVGVQQGNDKIIEKKVPLPAKWIKGLTTIQLFMAEAEKVYSFSRMQALQLFQSIPTGKPKNDYYLLVRGNKPIFSPVKSESAICIGGIHRLKLLEPLLAYADELRLYCHPQMQSSTWQLYFGSVKFSFSLSREAWRGFSGEGAILESLVEELPDHWIDAVDKFGYANQTFNPVLLSIEENIELQTLDNIAKRLSAMGLLGFDLDENNFYYRRLPFKLSRILSLNPRMNDAEKLLQDNKVSIISQSGNRIEAHVSGTGVTHLIVLDNENERCTCTWFSRHQGERGPCKHLLAVKKKISRG